MIKLVIFDLDDTLYPEIDFVKSGFKTVAGVISEDFGFEVNKVYDLLIRTFEKDRKFVFNRVLEHLNIYSDDYLSKLIYLYRTHKPEIRLYEDAKEIIPYLREDFLIGLITDGFPTTQRIKVKTLNIEEIFDSIIYTGERGKDYEKPSILPFRDMIESFQIKPYEAVYIGDNVEKDFKGPRDLGMFSIKVLRPNGIYGNSIPPSKDFEPDFAISSLCELKKLLKVL